MFAGQAAEYPVAALFAFPLQIGVVRVATLDTYRSTPGSPAGDELAVAMLIAHLDLPAAEALARLRVRLRARPGVAGGRGHGRP
ncbi:hypothetical protein AB0F52_16920 [Amycolatopsis sp. NPDC024027]|uniref:hypothetical protein n=1 Tax=Amycolatopsis sp. NPDC024027 TaxID=3154327 RepID=UPI0033E6C863